MFSDFIMILVNGLLFNTISIQTQLISYVIKKSLCLVMSKVNSWINKLANKIKIKYQIAFLLCITSSIFRLQFKTPPRKHFSAPRSQWPVTAGAAAINVMNFASLFCSWRRTGVRVVRTNLRHEMTMRMRGTLCLSLGPYGFA